MFALMRIKLAQIDPRIRKLLLTRYLYATLLCLILEWQLLALFLTYLKLNFSRLGESLWIILSWMTMSFSTMLRLHLLIILVAAYGLLLCFMQQQPPACRLSHLKRLQQNLQLKLCLLVVLVNLGYFSGRMYVNYVELLDMDVDTSYTGHFLIMNGVFCGLINFLIDYSMVSGYVWPLPFARPKNPHMTCLCWRYLNVDTLTRSILYTSLISMLYWPKMNNELFACFQHSFLSICINTLIILKMQAIKSIYGVLMHTKLPLNVQPNGEILPLVVALDVSCQLSGFQLQAAMDFYPSISQSSCQLFLLQGNVLNRPKRWTALRNVLLYRISLINRKLLSHLKAPVNPRNGESHRSFSRMRPLRMPPSETRYWSRRCGGQQQQQQQQQELCKPFHKSVFAIFLWLSNKILCWISNYYPRQLICPIVNYFKEEEEHVELCGSRQIIWLVEGLVSICIRSLNEDQYGSMHSDMEQIFQAISDLESLSHDVHNQQLKHCLKPCKTLDNLTMASTRAMKNLLQSFNEYLDYLVTDRELLDRLQHRLF